MQRREFFKFLRGVGTAAIVAPVAMKLGLPALPPKRAVRIGFPPARWRKLHEGVRPRKSM